MFLTTFGIALQAIRRHLLRSILTVLGIVIGVWSVVTMVTLGNATTIAVTSSISSLGSNTLTVLPGRGLDRGGGGARPPPFRLADADALRVGIAGLTHVAPQASVQRTVVRNAANWQTTINGTTVDYLGAQRWGVAQGRSFSTAEEQAGRTVCLVGQTIVEKLFAVDDPLDAVVRIGDMSCTIIGVMEPRGQGFGSNPDDSVLMPIKAVHRRLTGNQDVSSILLSYDPAFDADRVKADVQAVMRSQRNVGAGQDDNFNIFDARQIANTLSTATTLMTALLAAVGAVSLVVGGIGIMNIMLVSVTERTREIGIRLAVGAVASDVLLQFLVEAVVLCSLGGILGLLLANLTTLIAAPLLGVDFLFNPGINLLAFLLSAGIGILFGYVPARRASALDPIEALRHE